MWGVPSDDRTGLSFARQHRKHRSTVFAFLSVAAGTCLPSCCPETAAGRIEDNPFPTVTLLLHAMLQSLPSNGSIPHNIIIYVIKRMVTLEN
jgi:hypothetical protein